MPEDERRQSALRQTYEEKQAALRTQAALIEKQYGAELERRVSVAGVEDAEIKSLAVGGMARSIAAKGVQPPQISGEDFKRLTDQSIDQAYKLQEAQREKQPSAPRVAEQPQRDDPMRGVHSHESKRDYGDLQRTHEQVAAQQKQNPLSKEQLQEMEQRYADVRSVGKLEPTPVEMSERKKLLGMQGEVAERLESAHAKSPDAQQEQKRALLDHQHLAEKVGFEARWIGQHLRKQGNPGAESYESDARRVHQTARQVHEQRQNLEPGVERGQDHDRVVRQQDQQKRKDAQQAADGNTSLTSEQRANAPADLKETLDNRNRSDVPRKEGPATESSGPQKGNIKPGNDRPSGPQR